MSTQVVQSATELREAGTRALNGLARDRTSKMVLTRLRMLGCGGYRYGSFGHCPVEEYLARKTGAEWAVTVSHAYLLDEQGSVMLPSVPLPKPVALARREFDRDPESTGLLLP